MFIKVYSSTWRNTQTLIYRPCFMDQIAALQWDVAQAKKRIRFNPITKKYSYEPSKAYKRFLNKHLKHISYAE